MVVAFAAVVTGTVLIVIVSPAERGPRIVEELLTEETMTSTINLSIYSIPGLEELFRQFNCGAKLRIGRGEDSSANEPRRRTLP